MSQITFHLTNAAIPAAKEVARELRSSLPNNPLARDIVHALVDFLLDDLIEIAEAAEPTSRASSPARKKPKRWTPELMAEAIRGINEGRTNVEIGATIGMSDTAVCTLRGVVTKRLPLTKLGARARMYQFVTSQPSTAPHADS